MAIATSIDQLERGGTKERIGVFLRGNTSEGVELSAENLVSRIGLGSPQGMGLRGSLSVSGNVN